MSSLEGEDFSGFICRLNIMSILSCYNKYMTIAKNKTTPNKQKATEYIKSLPVSERDMATKLLKLFMETTDMKPVMWGNIVGFGAYHYKYEPGREGDYLATGFAMRKSGPTIYILPGYEDYNAILKNLGPHKLGKSCLYLKNLDSIDLTVLQNLIKAGLKDLNKKYPVQKS